MATNINFSDPPLKIGERVVWLGTDNPEHGTVRWIGLQTANSKEELHAGVEMDNPVGYLGTNDNFNCKQSHGIITPIMTLIKEDIYNSNSHVDIPVFTRKSKRALTPPLEIGERVVWLDSTEPQHGTVRWVGILQEFSDDWTIGVQFDSQVGNCNGIFNERRLFNCEPNYGMVIPAVGLIREDIYLGNEEEPSTSMATNEDNETTSNTNSSENYKSVSVQTDPEQCTAADGRDSDCEEDKVICNGNGNTFQSHSLSEDKSFGTDLEISGNKTSLAINKLLRKLEVAIVKGQRKEAGALARELAHLKINCALTHLRETPETARKLPLILNLFIEDKESHHGPIPIQVFGNMTVYDLKTKIFKDFEFPLDMQQWIIGRSLITDENVTLESQGIDQDGCPIYLYLVSPEEQSTRSVNAINNSSSNSKVKAVVVPVDNGAEPELEGAVGEIKIPTHEKKPEVCIGWECPRCTLINTPTRPGCEVCGCSRPDNYQVPKDYILNDNELRRYQREQEADMAFQEVSFDSMSD